MVGALYRVPILGGAPVEVVTDIDSPVAISPDHQRLAFVRGNPAERENYLMVMDLSTKNETRLGSRTHQERFSAESLAWSPDGKMLTIPVYRPEGLGEMMDVLNIDIASGEQTKLNKEPLRWVGQTAWLRDGSGLVAAAFTERSPDFTDELWIFSYPSGDIRKITNGINGQFGISVSADSNSIATIQSKRISSLWAMPVASFSGGETEQAAVNSFVINKDIGDNTTLKTGLDWTREGRIVYSSAKGGNNEIFSVNGDGSDLRQLTADALSDVNPIVSPNQDFIIFLSNRSGSVNLWRMNMDGTEQKQLTSFAHVTSPSFTPDGQWIFFAAYFPESQGYYLWKIPANGGDPVKLTDFSVLMPALSPDGKQLACYARGVNPEGQPRLPMTLSLLSSETGKIEKQFPELKFAPQRSALRWMPDGKSISYVVTNGGVSNIWTVSLSDEKTKRLSNWQTDEIFRYAWSDDGQKVAFEKGLVINDVLIISNAGK
jgi:TolB protein